jgi:ATP-dependent protease HslVU (ClpYQ) peptidase subunit
MSVLIAFKKNGTIYMGTDTRVVVGDHKRNEMRRCNLKIQKLDNGILLGITGERLERQTLIAYSEIFTLDKAGKLTRKHLVKEIVPRLISVLEEEKLMIEKEGEFPYMQAQIILAYKDTMYEICSSFAVIKYEDFQVWGRASDYAQATLMNTKETDDINQRIVKALDITADNSQYVGKPYVLIDTKKMKYEYELDECHECLEEFECLSMEKGEE